MISQAQVHTVRSMRRHGGYSDLSTEVHDWLIENVKYGTWEIEIHSSGADIFFIDPVDAVQFKLAMAHHYAA